MTDAHRPAAPRMIHHRTCNLCESMCGITIEHDGERVHSIRGDKDDPFSEGHICPKAMALKDLHEDPDRLRQPLRRTADGWETIGWDEAFDEVARQLGRVRREHGRDAIGVYTGNPVGHNYGAALFIPALLGALGTRNRFSVASVDHLPHLVVAKSVFGVSGLLPVPDLDRTDYLVIMGGNPLVSNGSIMTSGNVKRRLEGIRARGGRIVVIDPRKTETAKMADQHVSIRPGTDALLLLAVLHVIFREGLINLGHLADVVDGLDVVRELAGRFSPEAVAERTGVDAETIVQLARDMGTKRKAVWYGRVGTSMQDFGCLSQWLIHVINIATGHMDTVGGAMFTKPAVDLIGLQSRFQPKRRARKPSKRRKSRVRGLPGFAGEWPVATLADEITTPGEGQIRALVTIAGNLVLSTPNGRQLDEAFSQLDFMVAIDFYLNETTRHAHIILPPTGPLERDHYDLVFHAVAVRNTAKYSTALFSPGPEQRHDWQILLELSQRLGMKRTPLSRLAQRLFKRVRPDHVLDLALRIGPYGPLASPRGPRLSLSKLKREAQGIDFGPLKPCLRGRLGHPDKRIALAPDRLVEDVHRLENQLLAGETDRPAEELRLFGRRELRSKNSWLHNSKRLVKGKPRCTALVHPDDAQALGISTGDLVEVSSRVGRIELPAEVSGDVHAGTVCIPHGWGHARGGTRLGVADAHPGANVNDLMDDRRIDAVSGTSVLNGMPVQIRSASIVPSDRSAP